jgi:ketosteroid isomerase-like protein
MSQENVEIVRTAFQAYERGNFDEALASFDPDIAYKPAQEAQVHGRDAVRASWERWVAEWDGMEMTTEEVIDAGDHVIHAIHFRGRGRGSGIVVEGRAFQVFTFRDRKVVRWEEFSERSEALEAVGLSEQDAQAES